MIISNVNIGSGPGFNDGESIYSAFYKVNQNFANVQSNVNSLTNSVSSVAGRTGNVTLTINDIVGLNTTYTSQANLTAANVAMRGYVDAKIAANVAALIDSAPGALDTLNELAAALGDDSNFATTIVNTVTLANTIQSQQIVSANVGIIGYINLANTIQSAQISAANVGMKGYVDSVASQSIYGNANVASYLPTYGGNIKTSGITNNGNAVHLYSTLHIQGDVGGNGLFVGDPDVEVVPYGNSIASFHGNVNAPVYLNVHNANNGARSVSGIALTSDVGETINDSLILIVAGSNYNDPQALPNVRPLDSVIDSTTGNLWIGTVTKTINFYSRNYSPGQANLIPLVSIDDALVDGKGNLNIHRYVDLNFIDSNSKISFGDGSIQTTAYTGYGNTHVGAYTNLSNYAYNANVTAANVGMKGYVDNQISAGSYSNVQVATYLPTYTGNIQAGNVKAVTAYRFASGLVSINNLDNNVELNPDTNASALAGVKVGGNGYILGPNGGRNITLNYGSESGVVGLQANVTVGSAGSGNLVVNGSLTIRGNIINGNVAGFSIGYRDVPQVSAGNVTLGLTDAGKHYYATASAPTTLTIPSNANVAFPIGTAITVVNAGVGTITVGKEVEASLYLAGNSTNATRTLSSYGMATLLKTATDQGFINGTGLV